ncbi:MAG TPA: hypothetical protein VH639_10745 [Bryobacteraceae bacterium]|jgi:hypothetical protein
MSAFGNPLTEYSPQMEAFDPSAETQFTGGGVFSEDQEMELAAELLELQSEEELENFLGDLIGSVGKALGGIVRSPIGRAIGGVLKGVAKTALPIAGGALGGIVGGPIGSMLGSNLASMAGGALGLELEGLSPEDREFQAARQFCRFLGEAVRIALDAPEYADPSAAAHHAAVEAARIHAPGLMNIGQGYNYDYDLPQTGRWAWRDGRIVLFGVFR